jgi:polyphosphate glucokinase
MAVRKPRSRKPATAKRTLTRRVLAIDVGASGVKAAVIGARGGFLRARVRVKTPHPCPPRVLIAAITELVAPLGEFDCVTIGFPGYVKRGRVITAPNLGTRAWAGFPLEATMAKKFKRPVRLRNDADVQGLAVIKGQGLELVATLGSGLGTAWFHDGELLPHMELAHVPVHGDEDFDAYIGDVARRRVGHKRWNKRVQKVLPILATVLNYDHLYLGGGNAKRLRFALPRNVTIVSNSAGMSGGAFVWRDKD